ncbi:MAG: glycosyltransferase family protein [Acidobacteriota bacterium]
MARIFYSLSGEGRGHATRVRTVVEMLRPEHEVTVFASGDALEILSRAYRDAGVEVVAIPGLRFGYSRWGRLALARTALQFLPFLRDFESLVGSLASRIRSDRPDLVITDFEPALPRAARRCGVPFISLNHQHFLLAEDFGEFPLRLRAATALMGLVVSGYYRGQRETVVSSFHHLPLRRGVKGVRQIGTLLRPEVLNASARTGEHLVAYLRRSAPDSALAALNECGRDVHVYGLGERPAGRRLVFRAVDEPTFVADLAGAAALVATAGNQVVGEAIHLGKPVLAMPEIGNAEQEINAHLLALSGCGTWVRLDRLRSEHLRGFLGSLDHYRRRVNATAVDGNLAAFAAVVRNLPARARPRRSPLVRARGRAPLSAAASF